MSASLAIGDATELAVAAALEAGAGAADAYGEDARGTEIRVYEGEVESLLQASERGIGVRAFIDGRVGYAYGTDLSEVALRGLAADAVESAAVSDADRFAGLPDRSGAAELEGLASPALAEWSTEGKIELAIAIERAARAADDRVSEVEQTVYSDHSGEVALANSAGFTGHYEATSCYAYLQAFAGQGAELQTGLGLGMGREPGAIDPEVVGAEAAERAASLVGAAQPDSRACPVVLDPFVAASFIGLIGSTLSAEAVQRGRSLFAGRIGEEVAAPALRLSDDGLDPDGFGSAPFDDEGAASATTALVETGRLRTYLYDSYTARRGEARSTGNAGRAGYRSPPSVSTTNLVLRSGEQSFEQLLTAAGDGLYVTDVAGLHSGVNPVSGSFSVGASGRLIEAGELGAPVREITIASDLVSMLKRLDGIGAEARWVPFGGSVRTPALLIGEMTVSGK